MMGLRERTTVATETGRRPMTGTGSDDRVILTNALEDRGNPWLGLWLESSGAAGLTVRRLGKNVLLARGSDRPVGLHLQWPERCLLPEKASAAAWQVVRLLGQVAVGRARALPVLLTVHNVTSHERRHPRLEALFWPVVTRLVTDVHALSAAGRPEIVRAHPALQKKQWHVVPHGDYRSVLREIPDRAAAHGALHVDEGRFIVLFFGAIKPYKGLDTLVEAFVAQGDGGDLALVVAGSATKPSDREVLRRITDAHPSVQIVDQYLTQDELVAWISASDLVVLPYDRVLNSGSTFMALSCDRPVLVPRTPTFSALSSELPSWVRCFDRPLSGDQFGAAIDWARDEPRTVGTATAGYDWRTITQSIDAMWRSITARRMPRRPRFGTTHRLARAARASVS